MASSDFPPPKALPPISIPHSNQTVRVSIIDSGVKISTTRISLLLSPFNKGHDVFTCPAYSFLIEHTPTTPNSKSRKVLFDLNMRKDWHNLAPLVVQGIRGGGFQIEVDKNVSEVLEEEHEDLRNIEAIIWSHWHWDHIGNPSTFPESTDLIVGPGFMKNIMPGYPEKKGGVISESDYSGRHLRGINFSPQGKGLRIGRFNAFDYFDDGSFYLLNAPGHAIGHLCALARTTTSPPSFIFLGADCCHHPGEFRPTPYSPLPDHITPSPVHPSLLQSPQVTCPGSLYLDIHPKRSATQPFYHLPADAVQNGVALDWLEAVESVEKMEEFDAAENIFVVLAHDAGLSGVVEMYPKSANKWMEKGWAKQIKWAFLKDFCP